MSTIPALLGIDGGGTSTTAWLADLEGNVLGRGRAGPSNAKAIGPAAAWEALRQAIDGAFSDAGLVASEVEAACFGLAGIDRPNDRRLVEGWSATSRWARRLVLVNDGELVLAAGTPEGLGVAIIAGTGSIAVGCAADGRTARAGGWGHLFGDEGSAYAAALAGLRLVAQRADGRRPPPEGGDALTEGLCRALGINGPAGLIAAVYGRGLDRTALASLAPAVVAAGDADPVVRSEILEPAGRELARMVLAVVRALDLTAIAPSLPLAMGGGFLLGAPTVAQVLLDELDRQGLSVSATPVSDPVSGALVLARKALATC